MEWKQVNIPKELIDEIDAILKKLPYWTGVNEFVRDAIREKLAQCNSPPDKLVTALTKKGA